MPQHTYERLNSYVMGVIYSPLLLVTAWIETRQAHRVIQNRGRNEADDDTVEEWEQLGIEGESPDFEADGWAKQVGKSKPNVATDAAVLEVRELKAQVEKLAKLVESLKG